MITTRGMGHIHWINGIMCGPDYVEILNKHFLGTLKDLKLRHMGKEDLIFQQDNNPKHWSKVAESWFLSKNVKRLP